MPELSQKKGNCLGYPHYSVPVVVFADLVFTALTGGKRRFKAHANRMMGGIRPPLVVLRKENVPQGGPMVITVNHYYRAGFWTPWFAAAISATVPADIYWTITGAWTYPGQRFGRLKRWLSGQMLARVARVYGFNSMPPMPPAPEEATQRAEAVRRLVHTIRANPNALVALAPEGGDQPGSVLGSPPSGFGRLALTLAGRGMPFIPVGAYEEDGCFWLCFGEAYRLENRGGSRQEEDRWAADQVMRRIAGCLPGRLRGEYGGRGNRLPS